VISWVRKKSESQKKARNRRGVEIRFYRMLQEWTVCLKENSENSARFEVKQQQKRQIKKPTSKGKK